MRYVLATLAALVAASPAVAADFYLYGGGQYRAGTVENNVASG